jgi:hypothetical protein
LQGVFPVFALTITARAKITGIQPSRSQIAAYAAAQATAVRHSRCTQMQILFYNLGTVIRQKLRSACPPSSGPIGSRL